jgi:hypothetical protein
LPGETTLDAAAILASNGQLNIFLVIVAGSIGAITGTRRCVGWPGPNNRLKLESSTDPRLQAWGR